MEQIQIIGYHGLEPSKEEIDKIFDLQLMLKDHLASSAASTVNEKVRQMLVRYSTDRDTLLKFVRGRKLNLRKALDSIIKLANVKCSVYPELFPDRVPDYVRYTIKNEILTVLNNRDSLGRTIVLFRPSKWDVNVISLEQIICTGIYLTEALMNLPEYLRKGTILLTDCTGASINHAKHFTIPTIAKFVNVFWQAYPIQIKGLYYVNAPIFVRPVFSLVKPFLPKKLKERVLITPGLDELYERIEINILPESLGGHLPDDQAFSLSFLQLPD